MLLKRLELSGFKSFARATTLEFATPVTAIVGPNGSGKSNIVEAMRFVLGEQSIKSLRGKRGEDLIFHGSKSLPRQNRASVSVVFDNRKDAFPLDYDEVELRRIVYRDGTNQYFINGSKTRLKDILELLAAVHIGASSHHIISQGETDRILNASAKERRGMVEDALGLKIYHYKLAESEKKLQKTRENIAQTETVRKEIFSHLSFLEKQVEKIREAEALRSDLIELYKIYLKGEEMLLAAEKEAVEKEKAVPIRERAEIEKKIKEKSAARKEGEREEKDTARRDELAEMLQDIQKEKDALIRALGRLEGLVEYGAREKEKQKKQEEDSLRVFFPRAVVEEFLKNIRAAFEEGERAADIGGLRAAITTIKERIFSFFEKRAAAHPWSFDEEAFRKLSAEKENTAESLRALVEKEKELSRAFEEARRESEKDLGAERLIEKELFALQVRENELQTEIKLLEYREERLREGEARFHTELAEAGHLLGTQVLRFSPEHTERRFAEAGSPSAAAPSRGEQEKKKQKIERMKIKIEEIGGGGAEVMKEYDEVRERDSFLAKEISDLMSTAASLEKLVTELLERIDTEFKEGVEKINAEFGVLFSGMFGGGNAELHVVAIPAKRQRLVAEIVGEEEAAPGEFDEEEEEEEGIDITVTLPTKRVKGLAILSGGERSLTSIALVFAMTLVNPPPFLILDETDAALDESNSQKYGALLEKLKSRTQFIVITHNRETMIRAGVLYGVTSGADGASRVLSVKLGEAEELAE
ncbi:MAG: AAA family ATPase [Parcubacteria group bacterium]|nr:AAA family ATPase [Parcubacteria group bacterium]